MTFSSRSAHNVIRLSLSWVRSWKIPLEAFSSLLKPQDSIRSQILKHLYKIILKSSKNSFWKSSRLFNCVTLTSQTTSSSRTNWTTNSVVTLLLLILMTRSLPTIIGIQSRYSRLSNSSMIRTPIETTLLRKPLPNNHMVLRTPTTSSLSPLWCLWTKIKRIHLLFTVT